MYRRATLPVGPRLAWGKFSAAPAALRGLGENPDEVYGYGTDAPYRRPLLVGIGQDMPELGLAPPVVVMPAPDVVAYDPSLPYDRPGLAVNRGCPDGYFAQFQPPGDASAVHVQIPGIVADAWLRCRLMSTTSAATIASESGQTAAQSWYNFTNTGAGGFFGDLLNRLGAAGKWALGIAAVIVGGAVAVRVLK